VTLELQFYVDRPGRDLTIPNPGDWVWVDVEPGCFTDLQSIRDQGTANTAAGLSTGIYTSRYFFQSLISTTSTELADFGCPLWTADYRPPFFDTFVPYNGWQAPALWQYAGTTTLYGATVDLSITPDGRLFCDISNYTNLTPRAAEYIKATLDGCVIGLQDASIARKQKELLS
jgi:hypothetical protein